MVVLILRQLISESTRYSGHIQNHELWIDLQTDGLSVKDVFA